jgi:hypothetical protein
MAENFDFASELSKRPELIKFPGDLLMKGGAKNYIGAVLCVRATLYFKGGHTDSKREGIVSCFEEFLRLSGEVFTWLWREKPVDGSPKLRYEESVALRDLILPMGEDDHLSFCYTSGVKAEDAGCWQFLIYGQRGWKAKIGQEYSAVEFSVPVDFLEKNRREFIALVVYCSKVLEVEHGCAGFALNLSPVRRERNEPVEAFVSERMPGLDIGNATLLANDPALKIGKIKTVSWLTVMNFSRLDLAGGISKLKKNLPSSHFKIYDYGAGVVVQAGARPAAVGDEADLRPAAYIVLDHQLCDVRVFSIDDLHHNSRHGEIRLTGWAANQWVKRFDVGPAELPLHLRRLADEPSLEDEDVIG